jgi:hypothetical protein
MNSEKGEYNVLATAREYKLPEKERVYQKAYQYRYYHEKVKMKVVCDLCGCESTAKSLVSHKRTAKCKNLARERRETVADSTTAESASPAESVSPRYDCPEPILWDNDSPEGADKLAKLKFLVTKLSLEKAADWERLWCESDASTAPE